MGNDGSSEYEDKNILINAQIDPEKLTKQDIKRFEALRKGMAVSAQSNGS